MENEGFASSSGQGARVDDELEDGSNTTDFSQFLRNLRCQYLRFDVAGEAVNLRVVPIIADGNCLFRSLSYVMHGNEDSHGDIRKEIVGHISSEEHWNTYSSDIIVQMDDDSMRTRNTDGQGTLDNRSLRDFYREAMLGDAVYGRLTEATAFGSIHGRNIQVYQVISSAYVRVYSSRYDASLPTIRLLFSGDTEGGHFDLLLPDEPTSPNDIGAGEYMVSNVQENITTFKKIDDNITSNKRSDVKVKRKPTDEFPGNLAQFTLHTWKCPKGRRITENLIESGLVKGRPTVFVVHGYKGSESSSVIKATVSELLKLKLNTHKPGPKPQAFNIISVTWTKAASSWTYYPSRYCVPKVADEIFGMILRLNENGISTPEDTILIGHSLGGQICGFTGKYVQTHMRRRIGTIYALDAAGVGFDRYPDTEKLHRSDASHVTALHTTKSFGTRHRCGTVDTYINWRSKTPFLPHITVVFYFNRTIRDPEIFQGERRLSTYGGRVAGTETIRIGWNQNHNTEGVYYVEIKPQPPYDPENQS